MSPISDAKIAANQANAQHSTGPRTEEGQATSSKNATKSGLFATKDFIRPGDEADYEALNGALHVDLAPSGQLEHHHVNEIHRAMWRLRRCGEVEAGMVNTCAEIGVDDPMQNEATAKLQASVDRARAQCHRLINHSTAELRKLQTERQTRNETTDAGTDLSSLGICDFHAVKKAANEEAKNHETRRQRESRTDTIVLKNELEQAYGPQPGPLPVAKQTHPGRNSRCTCGSGQKYKHCCGGRNAPPLLHAA